MQPDDGDDVPVTLALTKEALGIIDQLVSCGLYIGETRESVALSWIIRWGRRPDQTLRHPDRYGPGTEPLTVTVEYPLWDRLHRFGIRERLWPDEVASAAVNDWGGELHWKRTRGTLM